jgi:hypothetical protein
MVTIDTRTVAAVGVALTLVLAGFVAPVAAQQEDCGTACLDPGGDSPAVAPGGGAAFGTPVVDLFLKAKKAFNEDFEAFLKAKKAF